MQNARETYCPIQAGISPLRPENYAILSQRELKHGLALGESPIPVISEILEANRKQEHEPEFLDRVQGGQERRWTRRPLVDDKRENAGENP